MQRNEHISLPVSISCFSKQSQNCAQSISISIIRDVSVLGEKACLEVEKRIAERKKGVVVEEKHVKKNMVSEKVWGISIHFGPWTLSLFISAPVDPLAGDPGEM